MADFGALNFSYPISPGITMMRAHSLGEGIGHAVDPFNVLGLGKGKSVDHTASDQLAALYRSDWNDYLARFAPEEQRQVDAMSDRSNAQERQTAIDDVNKTYAAAPKRLEQQAFTSGVTLTQADKDAYARKLNTEGGLAAVDAANRTTQAQTDRSYGIFSQPMYSPGGVGLNSMRGKII